MWVLALAGAGAFLGGLGACGEPDPECVEHDECWVNDRLSMALARCMFQERACQSGECRGWCAEPCRVALIEENPCSDPAQICNEPASGAGSMWHCQSTPVKCQAAVDCPKQRPGAGNWLCVEGVCRFPEFEYAAP
jgi:hypothetical protein